MQAIQNLGLGLASMAAGWIVDLKGYIMLENIFLMSLSGKTDHFKNWTNHSLFFLFLVTLVLIVICVFIDANDNYVLNMSAKERADLQKETLG